MCGWRGDPRPHVTGNLALDRALKVARTIADLAGAGEMGEDHLAGALQYRDPERVRPTGE